MEWVYDELPEEGKLLIVYDAMEGLSIGYYKAIENTFYSVLGDVVLFNVCAWFYAPDRPKKFSRIIDNVRSRYVVTKYVKRRK